MDRKLILLFLGSVLICVYVAVDWTFVERRFVRFELEWGLRSPTIVVGPKAGQGDSALVQQVKLQYFSDRQKSPQGGYEANAPRSAQYERARKKPMSYQ